MSLDLDHQPTVYAVQDTDLDLGPATRFGRLVPLLSRRRNVTLAPAPVLRELRDKLSTFSDHDFILPIGDLLAVMMATLVASEINHGRINVLKWDKRLNDYYAVAIELHPARRP